MSDKISPINAMGIPEVYKVDEEIGLTLQQLEEAQDRYDELVAAARERLSAPVNTVGLPFSAIMLQEREQARKLLGIEERAVVIGQNSQNALKIAKQFKAVIQGEIADIEISDMFLELQKRAELVDAGKLDRKIIAPLILMLMRQMDFRDEGMVRSYTPEEQDQMVSDFIAVAVGKVPSFSEVQPNDVQPPKVEVAPPVQANEVSAPPKDEAPSKLEEEKPVGRVVDDADAREMVIDGQYHIKYTPAITRGLMTKNIIAIMESLLANPGNKDNPIPDYQIIAAVLGKDLSTMSPKDIHEMRNRSRFLRDYIILLQGVLNKNPDQPFHIMWGKKINSLSKTDTAKYNSFFLIVKDEEEQEPALTLNVAVPATSEDTDLTQSQDEIESPEEITLSPPVELERPNNIHIPEEEGSHVYISLPATLTRGEQKPPVEIPVDDNRLDKILKNLLDAYEIGCRLWLNEEAFAVYETRSGPAVKLYEENIKELNKLLFPLGVEIHMIPLKREQNKAGRNPKFLPSFARNHVHRIDMKEPTYALRQIRQKTN